jgi:small subunit ribosomal protein S2
VQNSLKRYKELEEMRATGFYEKLSKKEVARLERERKKLEKNLRGIRDMDRLPGALFVIDSNKEAIAVKEAAKLGIPIVAVVDTNCDPDLIDYVIPGNDDALRAVRLFSSTIGEAVLAGKALHQAKLETEQKEAEEKAAKEAAARRAAKEAKEAAKRAQIPTPEETAPLQRTPQVEKVLQQAVEVGPAPAAEVAAAAPAAEEKAAEEELAAVPANAVLEAPAPKKQVAVKRVARKKAAASSVQPSPTTAQQESVELSGAPESVGERDAQDS